MQKLTIIIPVYNEEGNIHALLLALESVLQTVPKIAYEILFVDDGSTDETVPVIMSHCITNPNIFYISLSRNFGKDSALIAGLKHAQFDAAITIDADLQHPPALIPEFIEWWRQGYDVVYAFRSTENEHTGIINRLRSKLFYKAINAFSDLPMENGISDFKLIDRKVINVINKLREDQPFLRGIIKWVGFKQKAVEYSPAGRFSGNTKYTVHNLIKLATQGLTSFSTKPLTFAIYLGFMFSAASLLYIPYIFISFLYHWTRPGWASTIFTIAFFEGLQLMILGIIGLYLGKTFIQSKKRPRYIIQDSNFSHKDLSDNERLESQYNL